MPAPSLRVEVAEGVATLTLDRPEKLEALNRALPGEPGAALDQVQADPAIGALILTGAGERGLEREGARAFVGKRPARSRGR
jgi:enoyl-CoA hydratase/carnithine racemase